MKRFIAIILVLAVIAVAVVWWMNRPQSASEPARETTTAATAPEPEATAEPVVVEDRTPPAPVPADRDMLLDDGQGEPPATGAFKIQMEGLGPENRLPLTHSCYRTNQSPALSWSGAVAATQSYALMFERVDGDGNGDGLYWGVYNIPAQVTAIAAGQPAVPVIDGVGVQAKNLSSNIGYTGPCMPSGKHAFRLRVFALDADLSLPAGLDAMDLEGAIHGHVIDTATIPLMHYYRF